MKTLTSEEFHDLLRSQDVPIADVTFRCPRCGVLQSANDLINAGAGSTFDEVEKYLGFSCIGRFPKANGRGCDWTLGGLFRIHVLEVKTPDGKVHPSFEPVAKPLVEDW